MSGMVGVINHIGCADCKKSAHHVNNLINRVSHAHVVVGWDDSQVFHIRAEQVDLAFPEFTPVHTVTGCTFKQRINLRR